VDWDIILTHGPEVWNIGGNQSRSSSWICVNDVDGSVIAKDSLAGDLITLSSHLGFHAFWMMSTTAIKLAVVERSFKRRTKCKILDFFLVVFFSQPFVKIISHTKLLNNLTENFYNDIM